MEKFFSSLLSLSCLLCRRGFHKKPMVATVLARVLFSITGVPAGTESMATLLVAPSTTRLFDITFSWMGLTAHCLKSLDIILCNYQLLAL